MISNILKTLPRDYRLVSRHLKSLIQLKTVERNGDSVGKVFDAFALKNPEKIAFYFKDEKWSFREVHERSNKIGNLFKESGIKKADIVSLFMENRPEYICTWLGLSKIGAITALINFNLRAIPLKFSFELANSKAIICGYELAEALNDVYPENSLKIPLYGTGTGNRGDLKSAIDLDDEIHRITSKTPHMQDKTGFLDDLTL